MKFKTVPFFYGECQTCKGAGSITKLVKNNKLWKTSDEYVSKKTPCPDCKGKGLVKEITKANRFFPARMARKEYLKRQNPPVEVGTGKWTVPISADQAMNLLHYYKQQGQLFSPDILKLCQSVVVLHKQLGNVTESTLSGAGYPAATDTAGGQAIDKAPTLLGRKKKKKKMARRIKVKTTFVS